MNCQNGGTLLRALSQFMSHSGDNTLRGMVGVAVVTVCVVAVREVCNLWRLSTHWAWRSGKVPKLHEVDVPKIWKRIVDHCA